MRSGFKLLVFLCLAVSFIACKHRPSGVLSDKEMAPVIADLKIADAMFSSRTHGSDENKKAAVEFILKKHGVAREEFDSTMAWYGRNPDAYYELCDLAEKEILVRKKEISGGSVETVESTDLWPYSRYAMLSPLAASNGIDFSIPVSGIEKGGIIEWKFRANNSISGQSILGVEYESGKKAYLTRNFSEQKKGDISLQTDTAENVTRVFGNMAVDDRRRLPVWLDSIALRALPFDSTRYYSIHSLRTL